MLQSENIVLSECANDQPLLEPLLFPSSLSAEKLQSLPVECLLCNRVFVEDEKLADINEHLLSSHNLVIDELQEIANLTKYMQYWKRRFASGMLLHEFCSAQRTDTSGHYWLLSSALLEDREIREAIQKEKLSEVLDQQQKEREDQNFVHTCLFCTRHFHGNRSDLFYHMAEFHNFDVGDPDNLVYTSELLSHLEEKLRSLKCLYCEKIFKDGATLKEHMRKKKHKRLRSSNSDYRRFYIASYLDNQHKNQDDEESALEGDEDDCDDDDDVAATSDSNMIHVNETEWAEWTGSSGFDAVCLFCDCSSSDTDEILTHMTIVHGFDLQRLASLHSLTFYQQIKLINYMRRQIHLNVCTFCLESFDCNEALLRHLSELGHSTRLPAANMWNQPQYFFPTFENDSLLCALTDADSTKTHKDTTPCAVTEVTAEDLPDIVSSSFALQ